MLCPTVQTYCVLDHFDVLGHGYLGFPRLIISEEFVRLLHLLEEEIILKHDIFRILYLPLGDFYI